MSSTLGVTLSEEQQNAVSAVAEWYDRIKDYTRHDFKDPTMELESFQYFRLSGPAGSGKSTVIKRLLATLGLTNSHTLLAPTGKAAAVLIDKGNFNACTIHSKIYLTLDNLDETREELSKLMVTASNEGRSDDMEEYRIQIFELDKAAKDAGKTNELSFTINPASDITTSELVVVDESSMVDGKVMGDLLSFGVPVLFVGDEHQLPPINSREDSVFYDKQGHVITPDFSLTEVHRQAADSPIIKLATALRETGVFTFVGSDVVERNGRKEGVTRRLFSSVETLPALWLNANQIICAKNDTRHRINAMIRYFRYGDVAFTHVPQVGDKLIITANNKDFGVVNGDQGEIVKIYNYNELGQFKLQCDIELQNGRTFCSVTLCVAGMTNPGDKNLLASLPSTYRKTMIMVDYGYAITGHKAQGSQYPRGIVINDVFGNAVERRRWMYTAITRFETGIVIVDLSPDGMPTYYMHQ